MNVIEIDYPISHDHDTCLNNLTFYVLLVIIFPFSLFYMKLFQWSLLPGRKATAVTFYYICTINRNEQKIHLQHNYEFIQIAFC